MRVEKTASSFFRMCCLPVLAIVLVLAGGTAYGENVLDVYGLALDHDPQFKGASYERLALKEGLKQAFGHMMPDVSLEGVGTRTYQDIVQTSNPVFSAGKIYYNTGLYTAKLVQPIFRYSLFVEMAQAKKLSQRADVDLEIAKQDLIIRVAQAYLSALAASENVAFEKAEKKDVEVFFERAKTRYGAGMAPITDTYDAQARLAAVNAQLVKAENEHRDALQALEEITGSPVAGLSVLREELPLVPPDPDVADPWVTAGLEHNLKVKSVEYDVEVAKAEVSRQKSANYPSLDLMGRYYRNDMGGSLFGGGATVDTKDITLTLTVPVFEGLVIASKTREAGDRYEKGRQILEQQKRAAVRQVDAFYNGVKAALSKADALRKSVEAQTMLVQAKEQGYRSGMYASLAVLDAARDLYLYRRDYAQSRYDYIISNLKLKQAVGTLSESDLAAVNEWLQ
jgi:outer membrane protein